MNLPSFFYKDNIHPLALLWRKTPNIPGHSYISVNDQKEVKQSLKTIWVPHQLLSGEKKMKSVLEQLMGECVRGTIDLLWDNRTDVVYKVLFRNGRFKINKESIRLAVKLRFNGAIYEINKLIENPDLMSIT